MRATGGKTDLLSAEDLKVRALGTVDAVQGGRSGPLRRTAHPRVTIRAKSNHRFPPNTLFGTSETFSRVCSRGMTRAGD
jgi:hypothetical protein